MTDETTVKVTSHEKPVKLPPLEIAQPKEVHWVGIITPDKLNEIKLVVPAKSKRGANINAAVVDATLKAANAMDTKVVTFAQNDEGDTLYVQTYRLPEYEPTETMKLAELF